MKDKTMLPGEKAPETKVTAATIASYLLGVAGLTIMEVSSTAVDVLPLLPDWLQVLVAPLVPAAAAAVAGYFAPHTPRVTDKPHVH